MFFVFPLFFFSSGTPHCYFFGSIVYVLTVSLQTQTWTARTHHRRHHVALQFIEHELLTPCMPTDKSSDPFFIVRRSSITVLFLILHMNRDPVETEQETIKEQRQRQFQ